MYAVNGHDPVEAHESDGRSRSDGFFLRREDLITPDNAAIRARAVHTTLIHAKLSPLAWRVMMWVVQETLDHAARTIHAPHAAIATDLHLGPKNSKNVGRALRSLAEADLIDYEPGMKGQRVSRITLTTQAVVRRNL